MNVEARTLTGAGTPPTQQVLANPPIPNLAETRIAVRCNVCGHWLVTPESVALGVGPRCRGAADG